MSKLSKLLSFAACSLIASCSSKGSDGPSAPTLVVSTSEFTVPAGSEIYMCTVTDVVLDQPFDVVNVHSEQAQGGHHVALFYTTELEANPVHPCADDEMSKVRFIGGGAEGAEQKITLPPGMAITIPKGSRLVLQSHYVNATGTERKGHDTITAVGPTPGTTITTHADAFSVIDSDFRIPAHGDQTRITECEVPEDVDILNLFGHAHEHSINVKIGLVRAGKTDYEPLYNEMGGKNFMFSPPTIDYTADGKGLHLAKGDKIRLECSWHNDTDKILEFPSEMCVGQMYYAPAKGPYVCGTVVATKGDVVPPGGDTGMTGCTTPRAPTDPCVRPCDLGNSRGVGKYCTKGGHQCDDNQGAIFCTADTDPTAPGFCTKPCSDDAACGLEATCTGDSRGKGCVPVACSSM